MKKSVFVWLLVFLLTGLFAPLSAAQASGAKPAVSSSPAFQKIVEEYYRIHDALARDTTEGVSQAAQQIVKLASQAPQKGQKGPDFAAIKRAATALQGKNLEQTRQQFFELSKPIIAELKRTPPASGSAFAYKCSMANKSWVQSKKEIRNPYYGSSMLKCGEPL